MASFDGGGWVCERESGAVSGGAEDAAADSFGVDCSGAWGDVGGLRSLWRRS